MKFCCIPSPASNSNSSDPLVNATDDKPRLNVGIAAEVPRNVILSSVICQLTFGCRHHTRLRGQIIVTFIQFDQPVDVINCLLIIYRPPLALDGCIFVMVVMAVQ
jgi:hypothetical protein